MSSNAPTLVIIRGWPMSGKSTIAKAVSERLGIHWIDIDTVRITNFGMPDPYPNRSEELMKKDSEDMRGAYRLLCDGVDANLAIGRSLIVTATFSRKLYWEPFLETIWKNDARLRVIWCKPRNDSDEEIRRRLASREFGVNCLSTVNSLERYKKEKQKHQFPPVDEPYLEIDTSPPNTVASCVDQVVLLYPRRFNK